MRDCMVSQICRVAAVVMLCCAASPVLGQKGSSVCPTAGITVTIRTASAIEVVNVYHGADPADPVVCLLTQSTGGTSGSDLRRLYNIVDAKTNDTPEVRAALQAFVSGRMDPVRFTNTRMSGNGTGPYTYENTLRRAGHEIISVAGKAIDADIIDLSISVNGMTGTVRLWSDPLSRLIVKSDAGGGSFFPTSSTWQAISITSK